MVRICLDLNIHTSAYTNLPPSAESKYLSIYSICNLYQLPLQLIESSTHTYFPFSFFFLFFNLLIGKFIYIVCFYAFVACNIAVKVQLCVCPAPQRVAALNVCVVGGTRSTYIHTYMQVSVVTLAFDHQHLGLVFVIMLTISSLKHHYRRSVVSWRG